LHPTLSDLSGLSVALIYYPILIVAPGFAVGLLTNVFSFREGSTTSRLLIAIILSISIFPVVYYWALRFTHITVVWGVLGLSVGVVLYHLFQSLYKEKRRFAFSAKGAKLILGLVVFWVVMAFLLVDLKIDGQLRSSLVSYDYVKHTAVTDAISRTGVSPLNPSFYQGEGLSLFYYYFWFIFSSLIDQLGGELISPRHSIFAGLMWFPVGLAAITWFFVKAFGKIAIPDIDARYYPLIVTMLAVTGLDLLPIVSHKILEYTVGLPAYFVPSIEWWNEQVASWFSAIIWVPHHVSALVATLFVFILIRECVDEGYTGKKQWQAVILSSLAFSSAFGMSIWVSLVFLCFLTVWFVFSVSKRYWDEVSVLLKIGVLSLVFVLPFVLELNGANFRPGAPVALSIRPFFISDELVFGASTALVQITRLIFLPINYFLEIGFFFLGGLLYVLYRKNRGGGLSRQEWYLLVLLITSVIICSFVKANIKHNDLGWRGFMFAQMVLLLFSAPLYVSLLKKVAIEKLEIAPVTRIVAIGMLFLGITANIYEMAIIRTYSLGPSGERGLMLRELYEWVGENTDETAAVQHNPNEKTEYYHALYGFRQVLLADEVLGRLYGISEEMYLDLYDQIVPIFESSLNEEELFQQSGTLGIDFIVLKKEDPVWGDTTSWVQTVEPVFKNSYGRVYHVSKEE